MMSYSQPTASVTVENPRISGSNFLFDVYFMRTNNDPSWTFFGYTALGNSSWFFNWNTTALNTPTLAYVNTTLLPVLTYSNVVGNVGGQLAITTTVLGGGSAFVVTQDVWYHAFTVQCNIAGAGQAGITDHGGLSGLADDDHTQYLLVAGTRAMTGNLQMGDNDITGADTIQATASQNLTLKVSTGSSIVFQAV